MSLTFNYVSENAPLLKVFLPNAGRFRPSCGNLTFCIKSSAENRFFRPAGGDALNFRNGFPYLSER